MSADEFLCPICGHHVHLPQPCKWTFGAGRYETACLCPHADAEARDYQRGIEAALAAVRLVPEWASAGSYDNVRQYARNVIAAIEALREKDDAP